MTLREKADLMDRILKQEQIEKYRYTISQSEKQELNLENGGFKLLRTVFSGSASLRVFQGMKMGSAAGNDITEEGLSRLAGEAKAGITAADAGTDTYSAFIGTPSDWQNAGPYDNTLIQYYQGKYSFRTVTQLDSDLNQETEPFAAVHYGDWPAPEIMFENKQ